MIQSITSNPCFNSTIQIFKNNRVAQVALKVMAFALSGAFAFWAGVPVAGSLIAGALAAGVVHYLSRSWNVRPVQTSKELGLIEWYSQFDQIVEQVSLDTGFVKGVAQIITDYASPRTLTNEELRNNYNISELVEDSAKAIRTSFNQKNVIELCKAIKFAQTKGFDLTDLLFQRVTVEFYSITNHHRSFSSPAIINHLLTSINLNFDVAIDMWQRELDERARINAESTPDFELLRALIELRPANRPLTFIELKNIGWIATTITDDSTIKRNRNQTITSCLQQKKYCFVIK